MLEKGAGKFYEIELLLTTLSRVFCWDFEILTILCL